jgi:rhodanese-related sulfurtransferase
MTTIQPTELQTILKSDSTVQLLDVRTPAEHSQIHVPGVHLIPLDRLDAAQLAASGGFSKDKPVYILCQSGGRAKQAPLGLSSRDLKNAPWWKAAHRHGPPLDCR